MSWFGSGKKESKPVEKVYDETSNQQAFDNNNQSQQLSMLEQELHREKERLVVQTLLLKLADIGVEQCISKPSSSLTSAETSCITSVINKYFESTEFVVGRVTGGK